MNDKLTEIRNVIPMSFLRQNDAPGALGPTDQLDIVGAIRLMTEHGRNLEATNKVLLEALEAIAGYPHADHAGLPPHQCRIKARAAIKRAKGE